MKTLVKLLIATIICVFCPFLACAATPQNLSPQIRGAFLSAAEAKLRDSARASPGFWYWLDQRPQIRAGLLTSLDRVPAEFAENLDHLRLDLGPAISSKYAQLLLGVSLDNRFQHITPWPADGAYNHSAIIPPAAPVDTRIAIVADYLNQHHISLVDFVTHADSIMKTLGLAPLSQRQQAAFFDQLGYATGTYPRPEPNTLARFLQTVIARYETPLPAFKDKGPQWPLFPLDSAPWPLLAPMRQTLPQRELDYLWDRFNGKYGGKRLYGYGIYSWNYTKPQIEYEVSAWDPNSLPRIIEDGGVCGRLSTLTQLSHVGLGQPAVGMYQPGHRALILFAFDSKTRLFTADPEQGITGPDKSTAQWFLPAPMGPRVSKDDVTGIEYQMALALSMDVGLDHYTDSRIALLMANRLPAGDIAGKESLLTTATNLNPYDLEAWYAQARLAGSSTSAVNGLLLRLDTALDNPHFSSPIPQRQLVVARRQSETIASIVGHEISLAKKPTGGLKK